MRFECDDTAGTGKEAHVCRKLSGGINTFPVQPNTAESLIHCPNHQSTTGDDFLPLPLNHKDSCKLVVFNQCHEPKCLE